MRKKAVKFLFIIVTLLVVVAAIVKRRNKKHMICVDRSRRQDTEETVRSI